MADRLLARGLLGTCLALAGPVLLRPGPAGAEPLMLQTAWWWVPQAGPPAGTLVPSGGLLVQGEPAGATAEAAVLATVAGIPNPTLRLPLDARSVGVQEGRIVACPAESRWQAGPAQPWSSRPRADCSNAVAGSVSFDGTTVTFQVGSLVRNGDLDVVLLPGATSSLPPSANGSTFSAVFDPPTPSALKSSGPVPPPGPGPANGGGATGPAPDADGTHPAPQAEAPVPGPTTGSGPVEPVPPSGSAGAGSEMAQGVRASTDSTASPGPVAAAGMSSAGAPAAALSGSPQAPAGIGAYRQTKWLLTLGVLAAGLVVWRLPSAPARAITARAWKMTRRSKA